MHRMQGFHRLINNEGLQPAEALGFEKRTDVSAPVAKRTKAFKHSNNPKATKAETRTEPAGVSFHCSMKASAIVAV